jgi:hypothetical protein
MLGSLVSAIIRSNIILTYCAVVWDDVTSRKRFLDLDEVRPVKVKFTKHLSITQPYLHYLCTVKRFDTRA